MESTGLRPVLKLLWIGTFNLIVLTTLTWVIIFRVNPVYGFQFRIEYLQNVEANNRVCRMSFDIYYCVF